jgi:hypothetical protein
MPLTAAEFDVVQNLAFPLPPASREAFATAVANALESYPERGVGLAHRVAVELQRDFFTPPAISSVPQHHRRRVPENVIHHGRER